jgi:cell division protein FtsW
MRWALLGFIAMAIMSKFPYKKIQKMSNLIFIICLFLLAIKFIPGIGINRGGATRWIGIGSRYTIQPSELTKIGLIIFMANSLSKKKEEIRTLTKGIIPYIFLMGIVCGIIILEPDFSTAVIMGAIILSMVFVAGANLKYIFGLIALAIPAMGYLIVSAEYRIVRFMAFLNPWEDMAGDGYQIIQSLLALGSGGLFGQGLGKGKQKLLYIPEPQNDFIFSHIGEELGLIGTTTIIILFLLLIWRGIRVALHAPDMFASLYACGLVFMIAFQVIINIGVATSILPVTGIPLPFISAGGSSLFFLMGGIGILLNISRHTTIDK